MPPRGSWDFHLLAPIAAAALVVGLAILSAGPALGSAPPGHKVTICHATPPDTAANGWTQQTVDVASVGYRHSGHESRHDADIIPPYTYGEFTFAGKNWTAEGQAIWTNDCEAVAPTPVAPTATPEAPTATPTGEVQPTATPTGEVEPTATTNTTATPTATPTGEVLPATSTPRTTLPPTDMADRTAGGGLSAMALAMVMSLLALGSLAGLAMAGWAGRRTR